MPCEDKRWLCDGIKLNSGTENAHAFDVARGTACLSH